MKFPRGLRGALLFSIVHLAVPSFAEEPTFAEVDPVVVSAQVLEAFPPLKDMRSAWGDFDGDGKLDVVIMGAMHTGPNGTGPTVPVTRLYANVGFAQSPFRFLEIPAGLPQLRDGAVAWGDLDNDGDLDLAITGTTRTPVSDWNQLQFYILRNNGRGASPLFTSLPVDASLQGGRGATLAWGDMDNDGDLDLFVSTDRGGDGEINDTFRRLTSRLFLNDRGTLRRYDQWFLTPWLLEKENQSHLDWESDGFLSRRATWVDVNKDNLLDLILISDDDGKEPYGIPGNTRTTGRSARTEVWLNSYGSAQYGHFERAGKTIATDIMGDDAVQFWDSALENGDFDIYGFTAVQGGAGDWDGDGLVDLAFFDAGFRAVVCFSLAGGIFPSGPRPEAGDP